MLPFLDYRTVFFTASLIAGIFSVLMFGSSMVRKTYPGYLSWASAEASFSVLFLMQFLRGRISDSVPVLLGNLAVCSAMVLLADGVRRFYGETSRLRLLCVCALAYYLLIIYFFLVHNSFQLRSLLAGSYLAITSAYAALPALRSRGPYSRYGKNITALVLIFGALVGVLRVLSIGTMASFPTLFVRTPANTVFFLTDLMYIIGITFAFHMLTSERYVAELRESSLSLRNEMEERYKAEARLSKAMRMEAVARLAAGAAHFFNNQMCVVKLNCACLQESPMQTGDTARNVQAIASAADRASNITRMLMQFARSSSKATSACDVHQIIDATLPSIRARFTNNIRVNAPANIVMPKVAVDSEQLAEVLVSLAQNAAEAMPEGGEFSITVRQCELRANNADMDLEPGDYVRVSVSDTGAGMDEDTRQRVFEPFYTTKGLTVANGLSLAIAWGLLNESGGGISVESELNRGTTFHIYLPLADVSGP